MSKDFSLASTSENVDCLQKNLDEQYVKVERAIHLCAAQTSNLLSRCAIA